MKKKDKEIKIEGLATEICIWKDKTECDDCKLNEDIFCRPQSKYRIFFAAPMFIAFLPLIVEILFYSDFELFLKLFFFGSWIAYAFFFLNVWESRMLCNHCPYYANDAQKKLHCPIDKGKLKTGKYDPGPSSLSEKIQFITGTIIFVGYPVPILVVGRLWFSLLFLVIGVVSWIVILQKKVCTDCVNFACVLNRVPKTIKDAFLKRNPVIKKAWEEKGYKVN
jgi:hypothetical protein